MPKVEWAKAPAFAEVAETLGIRTDQVAAMIRDGDTFGVLWSTDAEPDDAQYVQLWRDVSGILQVSSRRRTLPNYFAELLEGLNRDD